MVSQQHKPHIDSFQAEKGHLPLGLEKLPLYVLQYTQITALACTKAPTGHNDWTLRLLAEKGVETGYSIRDFGV
jgi:hypothetical protein